MTKEELIKGLNEDLAAELGTVIRYTYQASRSFGLWGLELREMFARERLDEIGHAAFLMDMIVDLGGEPTTTPKPFEKPADPKEMLELDLRMENEDIASYTKRAALADELGFTELKLKLEEMAADEAGHARELRRILRGFEAAAPMHPVAHGHGEGHGHGRRRMRRRMRGRDAPSLVGGE
jgi:bacterioferritin